MSLQSLGSRFVSNYGANNLQAEILHAHYQAKGDSLFMYKTRYNYIQTFLLG